MISPNPPAGGDDSALAAYEELRRHRLLGTPGGQFGLVVLLREGVAAWIERRAVCRGPGTQPATDMAAGPLHAEVAQLLVSMVLNRGKEMHREY